MHRSLSIILSALLCVAVSGEPVDAGMSEALETLQHAEFATFRSSAVAELAERSKQTPLPQHAIAALLATAESDPYISVRLEATRLLVDAKPDDATMTKLGEVWASELANPVSDAWNRTLHPLSTAKVQTEVVTLLGNLYQSPYPDPVIDGWIRSLRSFAGEDALRLLQNVRAAQGFSELQISTISEIGARESRAEWRDAVYALAVPPLDANALPDTIDRFEHATRAADRLLAAYTLKHHFADESVPGELVAVANRIMLGDSDPKLRGVAARLVASGENAFSQREAMLLRGLRRHRHDGEVAAAVIAMYGNDRLHSLVTRYVAEPNTPRALKLHALHELERGAVENENLPDATTTALVAAAWSTSDYAVINGIERALVAWGSDVPLVVHAKSSDVQSRTLFAVLVLCVVLNGAGGLAALLFILVRPFRGKRPGAAKLGATVGWVVLSVVMLGLAALAFIGFLGHNAPPNPGDTLKLNVPLYLGTLIYLPMTLVLIQGARRSIRQSEASG